MEVSRVIEILCAYRGQELAADEIEVVPDLEIIDLYAARVAGQADYLVHAESGSVEEVDFDGWPPRRPPARARAMSARDRAARIDVLMSREVCHCRPEETLDRAAQLMWDNDCGCVPVCMANGSSRVVGMLTDRDVCMAALFSRRPLNELRVYEAMSREVRACRPADLAADVEAAMRERQIRRVPVVDEGGRLIGIVSLADIARAARGHVVESAAAPVEDSEIATTLAAICAPRRASPRP